MTTLYLHLLPIAQTVEALPWWANALVSLVAVAGTALTGLVGAGIKKLIDYTGEKIKLQVLARAAQLALMIVQRLFQVEVEHAKLAAADGKLTKAEAHGFHQKAVAELKTYLGPKGISMLMWVVGASEEKLEGLFSTLVESAVAEAKNQGKAARSGNPTSASAKA